jgi:hypothetical protein
VCPDGSAWLKMTGTLLSTFPRAIVIAILKFILWLMALGVVWLTLWARPLRKGENV